jgi:hypothetical protein
MVLTEARKRANEKWRQANKSYFADYYRSKYQNDEVYRDRCKLGCIRRRAAQIEIDQLMAIDV